MVTYDIMLDETNNPRVHTERSFTMKDFKKERSKKGKELDKPEEESMQSEAKVVKFPQKKNGWKIITTLLIIIAVAQFGYGFIKGWNKEKEIESATAKAELAETILSTSQSVGTATMKFVEVGEGENIVTVQEEIDCHDTYQTGAIGMSRLLSLQKYVYQLYKSDDITEELLEEYFSVSDNIVNLALSDSEIPDEEIEKYDDIIEEIPFINYQLFQFESSGDNVKKGIKGWLKAKAYWQILSFYQEKIPEEKYKTFEMIADLNYYNEEDCAVIKMYGEKLIETYIGDVKEVLASTEWRTNITTK